MKLFPTAAMLALAAVLASPLGATDLATMTDAEREAFGAEVRAYLMANPEVLMEAIGVLEERQKTEAAADDITLLQTNADDILKDPASWVGGNPEGDITLVEFTDYRCGYCRKAHDEVAELVKSDGNIRFIVKEFPILGEESTLSSRFAISVRQLAGDDAYKKAHDALITLRGDATLETLERLAVELGFDAPAVMGRMNAPEVTAVIDANHALGDRLKINGTPTFVIDQTLVRGYVPLDGLRQIVDGERKG
ncbi:MAG: DsbA family protein [Paracoccaceae bacterium]